MNIPDYGDYDDSQGRGHSRRPQGLCLVLCLLAIFLAYWVAT